VLRRQQHGRLIVLQTQGMYNALTCGALLSAGRSRRRAPDVADVLRACAGRRDRRGALLCDVVCARQAHADAHDVHAVAQPPVQVLHCARTRAWVSWSREGEHCRPESALGLQLPGCTASR